MALTELIKITDTQKKYLDGKKTERDNEYWRVLETLIEKSEQYDLMCRSMMNDTDDGEGRE